MRVARAVRACEHDAMNEDAPETSGQSAALVARAALIVATVALAVAILGLFLPV